MMIPTLSTFGCCVLVTETKEVLIRFEYSVKEMKKDCGDSTGNKAPLATHYCPTVLLKSRLTPLSSKCNREVFQHRPFDQNRSSASVRSGLNIA
jgi:hypothetical protein